MIVVRSSRVDFAFYRPAADHVYLAGDFNGWRPNQLEMARDSQGYWRAVLHLPPGVYQFRYYADDRWFCDFASCGIECGPFGPNGVIRITSHRPVPPAVA